jgi:hypothetical protein
MSFGFLEYSLDLPYKVGCLEFFKLLPMLIAFRDYGCRSSYRSFSTTHNRIFIWQYVEQILVEENLLLIEPFSVYYFIYAPFTGTMVAAGFVMDIRLLY